MDIGLYGDICGWMEIMNVENVFGMEFRNGWHEGRKGSIRIVELCTETRQVTVCRKTLQKLIRLSEPCVSLSEWASGMARSSERSSAWANLVLSDKNGRQKLVRSAIFMTAQAKEVLGGSARANPHPLKRTWVPLQGVVTCTLLHWFKVQVFPNDSLTWSNENCESNSCTPEIWRKGGRWFDSWISGRESLLDLNAHFVSQLSEIFNYTKLFVHKMKLEP